MTPTPQPGQLVEVRRRHYVVTDVRPSNLPLDPLDASENGRQHLVSLSSVEDDGLGEELSVLWEVEPGARVYERSALPRPDGFDEPERLDAFLHAVRWGAVSSADNDLLQAPFRSGIEIEDYQLEPLARALEMPRANLLIADDVGLGKTIEAGMVAQELIIRHRARTVLVLCPASLQVQWQEQMRDKFGLEFRIIDSAFMKELRRRDVPDGKYTLAFLGYGEGNAEGQGEIELTYNYGVEKYEQGNAFGHLAVGVPDVAGACEKVRTGGGKVTREAGPVKFGTTIIAFVEDPDGYKIELIQR